MKFYILLLTLTLNSFSSAQQLVLPGDYPDPSVVKIGDTYWASATTSNWFPAYPLLKSNDLVHWQQQGSVFDSMPAWADYYFWAPEMTYENNKVYVYYTAHKKDGNLCIAVASADRPEGPYKDHGPLMCEKVGSIDAFPMRDEKGKLYMIWKEDGNSVNEPTPIWAMEMNEERTALTGEKKELFRNDLAWERNLVEGVSMVRHGDYYYAFYAAAGCCGRECTYANGIARSKSLLGPWEKKKEPVLISNDKWKCPGHGTPIEKDGRFYFLYHAYNTQSNVYTGRQGLLQEFRFTPDGWIEFINDTTSADVAVPSSKEDAFNGNKLSDDWQWNVFQQPAHRVTDGSLHLTALPGAAGSFLGQKTMRANYAAVIHIRPNESTAAPGIAIIGDEKNIISAYLQNDSIKLNMVKDGRDSIITAQPVKAGKKFYLRMDVSNGKDVVFSYGRKRNRLAPLNSVPVDGYYLPPWDRALRAGVVSKGEAGQHAVFKHFSMMNK